MAETEKKVVDETTQSNWFNQEEIDKLKSLRDQVWSNKDLANKIRESWNAESFLNKARNTETEKKVVDETTQEVPEVTTPEVTTPEVTTPEVTTPEVTTPEIDTTEIDTTETEVKPDIPKPTTTEVDTKTETIKEEVPEKSQEQLFAEQNNINFIKWTDGSFMFTPNTAEEALDIGMVFWIDKISTNSLEGKSAKAVFNKYSKYKNAPKEVYTQGFKDNEIGVGGETWERLVKMNWGQPTAEMIQAQEEYDKDLKINNVNNTTNIIAWKELKTVNTISDIEKLDASYEKTVSKLFWDLATNWKNYKSGNDTLSNLNASMAATSASIDELNVEKRKVLDNVKKKYPNLSLGQQLTLAQQDTDAIDDQLFVLQRQYNSDLSTYKFEDTKAQWEFEYKAGLIDKKMKIAENLYDTQRWDLITQSQIERQDKLLAEEIKRSEKAKKDAIAQWDLNSARDYAYDIALAKAKAKVNKENKERFTTANLWDGAVLKYDKFTGEEKIIRADGSESTNQEGWKLSVSISEGTTQNRPDRNNNPWNVKLAQGQKISDVPWATWVDDENHLIFSNAKDGFNWMVRDVQAKMEWKSSHSSKITWEPLWPDSTLADLGSVYAEDPNWANAVANIAGVNKTDKLSTLDVNNLTRAIVKQEWFTWDIQLWGQQDQIKEVQETINGVPTILGAIWVPVVFERTIKSQIPATLLNSEVELEAANDVIKNLYKSGVSPEEASAMFQWFEVTNADDIKFWANLLQASRTINNKPDWLLANLSATINTWNKPLAVGYIEQLKESEIKQVNESAPVRSETKTKIQRLNDVEETIDKLRNKLWVTEGTFSQFVWRLKWPDLSLLQSKMEMLNAEERVRLFWTSQTWWETGAFDPLALQLWEKVETLLWKIDLFKKDEIRLLNNWRWLVLPQLNEEQILSDDALVSLYEQWFNPVTTAEQWTVKQESSFRENLKSWSISWESINTDTTDVDEFIN